MLLIRNLKSTANLVTVTVNHVTPILHRHPGTLNDSRCNSSSIEAGVLTAITGHGQNPPDGGTYYHCREVTQPPPLLYPRPEARTLLLLRLLIIHVLVVPRWER
ncbi:hypothetical protein AVEN_46184-1 [Araneus ventricosus]|uniref:Uncharacterized protein n=1 Tax=Araneus ventricosus TaxID=182803 RepID=A0A4Y2E6B6_ARAVE|nr:hypothetical protein AVEN_46184-1 [Araneus ventricosus]